jgi:hypothetical protein
MKDETSWGFRRGDLPEHWPTGPDGHPEQAVLLIAAQSELGGGADVLLSVLSGCGIPAFKSGSLGKVIFGFAGRGVDIYVPRSMLEDAREILNHSAQPGDEE